MGIKSHQPLPDRAAKEETHLRDINRAAGYSPFGTKASSPRVTRQVVALANRGVLSEGLNTAMKRKRKARITLAKIQIIKGN